MRKLWRFAQNELGDTLIEFSLSAVVLMMAIFGVMDCSRALYIYHFVSYAAQQGTRYAIVRGANWGNNSCVSTTTLNCNATAANVTNYVQSIAPPGVAAGSIVVTATWPGENVNGAIAGCSTINSQGCLVKVKVRYSFNFILPFLPNSAVVLKGTSEEAIQD
jgi:Flp pilus assembly protein TadG